VCLRAQGSGKRARAPKLAVFVKREGQSTFVPMHVSGDTFVGDLTELVAAKLKLEAPLDAVSLTKEGEDTPLDSRLTVQEALGGVARPSLIVKAPKVERAPGAWLAMRGSLPAIGRARARQRRCARAACSYSCKPNVTVARAFVCRCAQSALGRCLRRPALPMLTSR
jgi:hypothetical protein